MRKKTEWKMVIVKKEVYDRLVKDRKLFQKIIGGGKWSFNDTITEYLKIINSSTSFNQKLGGKK
jgi:hypothetical protein